MADIYLVGVGGQGIITASKIIVDAAILAGKNVLLSETHGMAQRGGSVVCTARIGEVYSPLIPDGQADVVLSFELLETLRAVCKASKNTVVVSSTEKMIPLSVSTQKLNYPTLDEVRIEVAKIAREFVLIEASKLAGEAGVPMSSNIVMVGALAGTGLTNLDKKHFEKALEMNITRNVRENLAAFSKGFDAMSRGKSA
ncbi:indolepyruvate oxidoreductase subunit beta [Candidatus Bathyarchaeota archaeon]|nr:indolepyruvate oxidoreductase subunit beta [Candidatus Bathyarchaeota archaeon]